MRVCDGKCGGGSSGLITFCATMADDVDVVAAGAGMVFPAATAGGSVAIAFLKMSFMVGETYAGGAVLAAIAGVNVACAVVLADVVRSVFCACVVVDVVSVVEGAVGWDVVPVVGGGVMSICMCVVGIFPVSACDVAGVDDDVVITLDVVLGCDVVDVVGVAVMVGLIITPPLSFA